MTSDGKDSNEKKQAATSFGKLGYEAASLGFGVLVCVLLGVFLDNTFKTAPVFILVGVFLALASVGYFFWRLVKAAG